MLAAALKFLFTQVIPRLPFLTRLSVAHSLGLLETSPKWDLRTTLLVRFIRALIGDGPPKSVSYQQKVSMRDPGISGPIWVSSVDIPKQQDGDDLLATLLRAVDARKEKGAKYDVPESADIYAEWTGYRQGANSKTSHAKDLSEAARYQKLMADTKSETTVLYMHGGGLYLMDVGTHRPVCSTLARISGGRCLSIRYRLAPKHPFPAALLDCLMAYLYLLSPPPGSFHAPVPASKIVFAGDSAGGNLSCALLQLLLEIHRASPDGQTPRIRYQSRDIEVPLPAGIACSSAWVDLTRTMPSIVTNYKYDYLPLPTGLSVHDYFPACDVWPTNPRREDMYCDGTILMHPFASPLATSAKDWKNSPPVFLIYGEEMLTDEGKYLARTMIKAGVAVQWDEFEGQPHCFEILLRDSKVGKLGLELWGDFIARVTKGQPIETRGTFYKAKSWEGKNVDVASLGELTDNEVWERMNEEVQRRESYLTSGTINAVNVKAKL